MRAAGPVRKPVASSSTMRSAAATTAAFFFFSFFFFFSVPSSPSQHQVALHFRVPRKALIVKGPQQ